MIVPLHPGQINEPWVDVTGGACCQLIGLLIGLCNPLQSRTLIYTDNWIIISLDIKPSAGMQATKRPEHSYGDMLSSSGKMRSSAPSLRSHTPGRGCWKSCFCGTQQVAALGGTYDLNRVLALLKYFFIPSLCAVWRSWSKSLKVFIWSYKEAQKLSLNNPNPQQVVRRGPGFDLTVAC